MVVYRHGVLALGQIRAACLCSQNVLLNRIFETSWSTGLKESSTRWVGELEANNDGGVQNVRKLGCGGRNRRRHGSHASPISFNQSKFVTKFLPA